LNQKYFLLYFHADREYNSQSANQNSTTIKHSSIECIILVQMQYLKNKNQWLSYNPPINNQTARTIL